MKGLIQIGILNTNKENIYLNIMRSIDCMKCIKWFVQEWNKNGRPRPRKRMKLLEEVNREKMRAETRIEF